MIYLKESGEKLEINFGKRKMKVLTKKAFKILNYEASTYWIEANFSKYLNIKLQFPREFNSFQSKAMMQVIKEEFTRDDLKYIGNNI